MKNDVSLKKDGVSTFPLFTQPVHLLLIFIYISPHRGVCCWRPTLMASGSGRGEGVGEHRPNPIVRVVGVNGPLFVCEDSSVLSKFPQMYKKDYSGPHLGVEELEYLSEFVSIEFITAEDRRYWASLRMRHEFSCRVYRHLTDKMGLFLRHGSQFGAAFIGYRDLKDHGNCLVYFGPLSQLSATAAARVAASVGKEAWVVEEFPIKATGCLSVSKIESYWGPSGQGGNSVCGDKGGKCVKKRRLSYTPIVQL